MDIPAFLLKLRLPVLQSAKTLQQAAALPYVWTADGLEVAMVTSRGRGRWIVPKGWPEKALSLRDVAALEALEEAGLEGEVAAEPVGFFDYPKQIDQGYKVACRVLVFPLLVSVQRLRWKEQKQRRVAWMPVATAAIHADDVGLARLLAEIAADPNRLKA
jgi:8-oxo-dGTP pyrophosphatase MutT (NUDIX family)